MLWAYECFYLSFRPNRWISKSTQNSSTEMVADTNLGVISAIEIW